MNGWTEIVSGMLWSIATNPSLMIIIWFFAIILEFCWSGLRNLLTIILFPGKLIHIASHIAYAHIKGIKMRFITILSATRERSFIGIILSKETPLSVAIFCLSPIIIALPLYILFIQLATIFRQQIEFSFLFLWLALSIFIEGMPSAEDLGTILKMAIYYEPLSIIFLSLTPAVYVLNTYGYGTSIGTYITLIYVLTILILSIVSLRRERTPTVYGAT